MRRCALACAGVRKAARQVRTRREETRRRVRWMPPEGWRRGIGPQWKMRPQRARRTQAGGWAHIRSSGACNAPTDMMRALGALFAPERPGASPRPRSGAATPMLGDTTQRHQPPHGQRRQPASACPFVPHPVSWTHVCATRHGVARIPRALRAACDTPASRGASTGCSVRRTRRRPRAHRRDVERPGRRRLAP